MHTKGLGRGRKLLAVASILGVLVTSPGVGWADPLPASFAPRMTASAGDEPVAVAIGNMNADANADVVVSGWNGSISVLLGDGTGHFPTRQDYAAGGTAFGMAIGDVNGDTFTDVVRPDSFPDTVSVFLGDGAGGLGPRTTFPACDNPYWVALADLNGDGALDIVLTGEPNTGFAACVLLGVGDGTFNAFHGYNGPFSSALAVGDVNGDGVPDFASGCGFCGGTDNGKIGVALGHADGSLSTRVFYSTGLSGDGRLGAAMGDFNGDSFVDLAMAGPNAVSVLLGNGTGAFPTHTVYPSGSAGVMTAADVNNDTVLDLVGVNAVAVEDPSAHTLSVLAGNGDGTFAPRNIFGTGNDPRAVAVADLNHDGNLDAVTADVLDDTVSVLLGRLDRAAVVAGDGQATVSWTPPPAGTATAYVVTPYIGYYPLQSTTFDASATTHVVTGLTNGTAYRFKVTAMNGTTAIATSRVSNAVTPAAVPGAPIIGHASSGGSGKAVVRWTAPSSDGGSQVTGYVVTPYIGYYPLPPQTFMSSATTQTVSGLQPGISYRFKVAAINTVGTGPSSHVSNPVVA